MTDDKEERKINWKQFKMVAWGHPFKGMEWELLPPVPKHTNEEPITNQERADWGNEFLCAERKIAALELRIKELEGENPKFTRSEIEAIDWACSEMEYAMDGERLKGSKKIRGWLKSKETSK